MPSIPARRSSTTLWNLVKIILAIVLVGYVVSRTSIEQLRSMLAHISVSWLVGYVILFLSLTLLKALQYYYLNGEGVSFPSVLNVVVMQNVVTNYFASTAGIASYIVLFRAEHGVKVSRAAIVFLLTKIGDLIILWISLCVSSFFVWQTIEVFHNLVWALVLGIGGVILVFFLTILFRRDFVSLVTKLLDVLRLSRISLIQKGIGTLEVLSDIELRKVARIVWVAFFLSTIYFVLSVDWIYVSFMTFNFQQDIQSVIFVSVMLQLISYVPIQVFGGLGITETSVMYFWHPFHVQQDQIASVMIGIRLLFYIMNLVPLLYLPIYTAFLRPKDNHPQ